MIDFWIGLPLIVRLGGLAILGILIGAFGNYATYNWAYFRRAIDPWSKKHEDAPERKLSDKIPIVGWFGLRRESEIHGKWFWVRPILIEIGVAMLLPALYWYETEARALFPNGIRPGPNVDRWCHLNFIAHAILIALMVPATFIDFDEQTIPDQITIPGTVIGLALSSISLYIFMPVAAGDLLKPVTFLTPVPPAGPIKWRGTVGLLTGLAIWTGWCFALADRRLITRKGFRKAIEFFFAGLVRHPTWKLLVGIWVAGLFGIGAIYALGDRAWYGLLSSLIGLAVGGSIVWVIRIIGSSAMNVEAMGFGDVTLMAMIGAFVGWQAAGLAFFLAPFAAIAIVIIQFVVTRDNRIPFGPYLCAGTMLTIIFWDRLFNQWFIDLTKMIGVVGIWMGVAIFGLMWLMLYAWRKIKEAIYASQS